MNANPYNRQITILIVEDTPFNLRLLSSILKRHHYLVRTAKNGKTALLSVEEQSPDLILLDINMPDMNGYEVCQQLKSNPQTRDIPVIFISALDKALDKIRAFNVGGIDYIPKPFQNAEVLIRVKNHITLNYLQNQVQRTNNTLTSSNTELVYANNNLAAANEELESAYDQLASMNDNLENINDTLAQRNLELEQVNSNLNQMTDKLERQVQKRTQALKQVNQAYERFFPQEMLKLFRKKRIFDLHLGEKIQKKILIMSLFFYKHNNSCEQNNLFCEQLHDSFLVLEQVSHKYHGFIQSYHTDGRVLLFFPLQVEDGLQAALETQEQLSRNPCNTNITWGMALDVQKIQITLVGTEERMQLLSCSPCLEQLTQLNAINRRIKIPLLMTENVWLDLKQIERYHSRLLTYLKNHSIFEVLDAESEQKQRTKLASQPQFENLVQRYHKEGRTPALIKAFQHLKQQFPTDNSIDYYD